MPARSSSRTPPTRTGCPSTAARTPWPVTTRNRASRDSQAAVAGAGEDRRGQRVLAVGLPPPPRAPAVRLFARPGHGGRTSGGPGLPAVMVPVLSSTIVSSFCAVSSASADRMRIPARAPLPVPTWTDSGVARPSAHGQAMISTAIATAKSGTSTAPGGASDIGGDTSLTCMYEPVETLCRFGQAGLVVAGRNATNGWVWMKSRTAASSRRSPQPRIVLIRRIRRGCSRRNPTAT